MKAGFLVTVLFDWNITFVPTCFIVRESTLFLLNLHNINSAEAQLLPTACSVVWQLTSVIAHNMPRRSNRSSRVRKHPTTDGIYAHIPYTAMLKRQ